MERSLSKANKTERYEFMHALSNCIANGDEKNITKKIQKLGKFKGRKGLLLEYREKDETILHIAAKFQDDEKVVTKLLELQPELLPLARSGDYEGQTALHIAIARKNYKILEELLRIEQNIDPDKKIKIVETLADGTRFQNTVMMGQSPLSVAALKCDSKMVDILLSNGADLCQKNTIGDTVFHSLIKYVAIHPEKGREILEIFDHLNKHLQQKKISKYLNRDVKCSETITYSSELSYIWFETNNTNLNPLQLAAKCGVVHLFEYIINIKDVYYFLRTQDGLFDIKMYDITDIDTVANRRSTEQDGNLQQSNKEKKSLKEGVRKSQSNTWLPCGSPKLHCPETESILEMMFNQNIDSKSVFRIIESTPVKNLIRSKWSKYSWIHLIWMIVHLLFLFILTYYSVIRTELYQARDLNPSQPSDSVKESWVRIYHWIGFFFSIIYFLIFVLVFAMKFLKPSSILGNILHNLQYVLLLLVFSICYFVDTHYYISSNTHNSEFLIVALIAGWWFTIFFLRAFQHFSFFTELISRVIVGDLFRFSVVISLELISFTAAMYIMFAGRKVSAEDGTNAIIQDENFSGYFTTMLTMFKLMLGLSEIDVLHDAKSPGLAIALFIIFVIMTYVLMVNALIAMMSQTCALVLEDRYPQWRIQQLSVILFLEDMFCLPCLSKYLPCPGESKTMHSYSQVKKKQEKHTRYFLEIHFLQMELASEEDKDTIIKREQQPLVSSPSGQREDSIGEDNNNEDDKFLTDNSKDNNIQNDGTIQVNESFSNGTETSRQLDVYVQHA